MCGNGSDLFILLSMVFIHGCNRVANVGLFLRPASRGLLLVCCVVIDVSPVVRVYQVSHQDRWGSWSGYDWAKGLKKLEREEKK